MKMTTMMWMKMTMMTMTVAPRPQRAARRSIHVDWKLRPSRGADHKFLPNLSNIFFPKILWWSQDFTKPDKYLLQPKKMGADHKFLLNPSIFLLHLKILEAHHKFLPSLSHIYFPKILRWSQVFTKPIKYLLPRNFEMITRFTKPINFG